jgi:hypothetical protein
VIVAACRRLSGWRAALLCVALLVPDHGLIYLGVTDMGRPNSLALSLLLLMVVGSHADRPRWRSAVAVAVVVFVGTWTRLDFVWFVGAAIGACLIADVCLKRFTTLPVVVGAAIGLGMVVAVVPQYFVQAAEGLSKRIPLTDYPVIRQHVSDLLLLADPWGTYRRQVDVVPHLLDGPYVAWRRAYLALALLVPLALGILALRRRRAAHLVLAAFPVLLLAAIAETQQSYEVHHIVDLKPALYVAVSVLAAELARGRARIPVLAAWAALALGALWVQTRAFADLKTAGPPRGEYWGVTWNMSDAWQAAARSSAKVVFGANFGVWVPGVLSSAPDQRWESGAIPDEPTLDREMRGRDVVGFVFMASGPSGWLLGSERYRVLERRVFDAHPGDAWAFMALAAPSAPPAR